MHFPIALLTVYAVLECVWSVKFRTSESFFWSKFTLLTTGFLGACAALMTGDGAEQVVGHSALVETHSTFAGISTIIFAILLAMYLIRAYQKYPMARVTVLMEKHPFLMTIYTWKIRIASYFLDTPIVYLLAILGLIAITITGSLGGAIVYGPDADPIVQFIYHLFLN